MGLFLAMSGIAGASRQAVEKSLREFTQSIGALKRRWRMESVDVMVIGEAEQDRITVLYPAEFMSWDQASAHLSRSLSRSLAK